MSEFVSLIHGARRLYLLTPNRSWMGEFAEYLQQNGVTRVSTFEWSGAFIRGLQLRDAPRYAEELLREYRLAQAAGGTLSIVAKSLGALIAERAIVMLAREIRIRLFLRVGVPDLRTTIPISGVSRIVNVTSDCDRLYRYGLLIVPRYLDDTAVASREPITEIRLPRLSHAGLTRCTHLSGASQEETTYSLYRRLLSNA